MAARRDLFGRKDPALHHEVNEVAQTAISLAKLPDYLVHLGAVGGLDHAAGGIRNQFLAKVARDLILPGEQVFSESDNVRQRLAVGQFCRWINLLVAAGVTVAP